ncbi:hypothetical protein D3C86_350750 [compost metagenome]
MVDADIEEGDIRQQYENTIVLYKNNPVYVTSCDGKTLRIVDMKTQKTEHVQFSFKTFSAPAFRLGMVNCHKAVVYLTRVPYRRMNVGICKATLNFQYPRGCGTTENQGLAGRSIQKMFVKELANTILGDYPTFEHALKFVKDNENSAMAFDRQFAITSDHKVFFKMQVVGNLKKGGATIDDIIWSKDFEHLHLLLGDNCEKIIRASRA